MADQAWRIGRVFFWWGTLLGCLITLVQGPPSPSSIVILTILGATAASVAIFEHGWHRAPIPFGTPVKSIVLLGIVWCGMGYFAYKVWPPSREEIVATLTLFAQKGDWDGLTKEMQSLESNPSMHDLVLYFTGMMDMNSNPAPDPDRYLSQVPEDSDFFEKAQELRVNLYVWGRHDPQLKASILDALAHAGLRNSFYYRLRLEPPFQSFTGIRDLQNEFMRDNQSVFNFSTLKLEVSMHPGVRLEVSADDVMEAPACLMLFYLEEMEAAQNECLAASKAEIWRNYKRLVQNVDPSLMQMSLKRLCILPGIERGIETLNATPVSKNCPG